MRRPRAETDSDVALSIDALRRIVQALRTAGRRAEARGLGGAQLFVLRQIADHPGASINDIAALTFTDQSTVSVLIQRLVDGRLVSRAPAADDRRRRVLAITKKGHATIRRSPPAIQDRLIAAIAALPPAERRDLSRALSHLAVAVTSRAERKGRAPLLFGE